MTKLQLQQAFTGEYSNFLGSSAYCVFTYLVFRSNKNNECWPSQKRMAYDLGMNIRTVVRTVKLLAQWNVIKHSQSRENGQWSKTTYTILPVNQWKPLPCDIMACGKDKNRATLSRTVNKPKISSLAPTGGAKTTKRDITTVRHDTVVRNSTTNVYSNITRNGYTDDHFSIAPIGGEGVAGVETEVSFLEKVGERLPAQESRGEWLDGVDHWVVVLKDFQTFRLTRDAYKDWQRFQGKEAL